jgi:excisionase family DNA binding protein
MIKLYTVVDVCKYFKISRNTVYTLILEGKIRSKKVGRAYVITENSINEFINFLEN